MEFPLADIERRETGSYPQPQNCLVCTDLVDASQPHFFVRDADETLDDNAALIGLLHIGCEEQYIAKEDAKGVRPPDDGLSRWQAFVDRFELQNNGANPWDAKKMEASCQGASHGEQCTIRFLLAVWSPHDEWSCGTFDFIDAISTWDEKRREAFLTWASDPWWP